METVTRSIDGSAGARLFAIDNAAGFNRIVFSGPSDFAIARLRFGTGGGPTPGVPEPATMVLLGIGLAGVAGAVRRHRKS